MNSSAWKFFSKLLPGSNEEWAALLTAINLKKDAGLK